MDIQGYTAYDSRTNQIVVSFRGSITTLNWIANIDFIGMPYFKCWGCFVHSGFFIAYQAVAKHVVNSVFNLKYKYPNAKILVTSHSLGAAVATHAALDIVEKVAPVDNFYAFGLPRIGNL